MGREAGEHMERSWSEVGETQHVCRPPSLWPTPSALRSVAAVAARAVALRTGLCASTCGWFVSTHKVARRARADETRRGLQPHVCDARSCGTTLSVRRYDVYACPGFVEERGIWLRLMPDAGFVPT